MQAIDIGNAFAVMYNGKSTHSIRSVIADVASKPNVRTGDGVLEYQKRIFHLGDPAFRYPVQRLLAEHDKQDTSMDDALLLTLYLITPPRGRCPDSTEIVIQVPDLISSYQHDLTRKLNGFHIWSLDGKEYNTKVTVTNTYQEGFGSWYLSQKSRLIPTVGYTLVCDLGGGTVIMTLIDNESGEVVRVATYKKSGVIFLANLIREDNDLYLANNGVIPPIEKIFQGMESGTNRIGVVGTPFESYIKIYAPQWWKHIRGKLVGDFGRFLSSGDVVKVLMTGGGTEIIRPYIEGASGAIANLFAISPHPVHDNVIGIYNHAIASQQVGQPNTH